MGGDISVPINAASVEGGGKKEKLSFEAKGEQIGYEGYKKISNT